MAHFHIFRNCFRATLERPFETGVRELSSYKPQARDLVFYPLIKGLLENAYITESDLTISLALLSHLLNFKGFLKFPVIVLCLVVLRYVTQVSNLKRFLVTLCNQPVHPPEGHRRRKIDVAAQEVHVWVCKVRVDALVTNFLFAQDLSNNHFK